MRAVARIINGCLLSTSAHAVMAKAGLGPVASRRETLMARLLANALALPGKDPLRVVAEANPPPRLKTTVGWRTVGKSVWATAGMLSQ